MGQQRRATGPRTSQHVPANKRSVQATLRARGYELHVARLDVGHWNERRVYWATCAGRPAVALDSAMKGERADWDYMERAAAALAIY